MNNIEELLAAIDAVKMLVAAFDDVSQSIEEISKIDVSQLEELIEQEDRQGWISVDVKLPSSDDQLVVVCTDSGSKYFDTTINGKFRKQIKWWLPLPPVPQKK